MKARESRIGCLFLIGLGTWLTIVEFPSIVSRYNLHTPMLGGWGLFIPILMLFFGILWAINIARQKPKV